MPETILMYDPLTRLQSVGLTRTEETRHELEEEMITYIKQGGEKLEPDIMASVEGQQATKSRVLRSLIEEGIIQRDGKGRKGDPFKYSYASTEPIARTSVRESPALLPTTINTDEILIRDDDPGLMLVPASIRATAEAEDEVRL
jgi:hypothetical protein